MTTEKQRELCTERSRPARLSVPTTVSRVGTSTRDAGDWGGGLPTERGQDEGQGSAKAASETDHCGRERGWGFQAEVTCLDPSGKGAPPGEPRPDRARPGQARPG